MSTNASHTDTCSVDYAVSEYACYEKTLTTNTLVLVDYAANLQFSGPRGQRLGGSEQQRNYFKQSGNKSQSTRLSAKEVYGLH
jgi:hypothetical protein